MGEGVGLADWTRGGDHRVCVCGCAMGAHCLAFQWKLHSLRSIILYVLCSFMSYF